MRRIMLGWPLWALLLAFPAAADTMADTVSRQLRDQGYERVETSYTWLGRLRVDAVQGDMRREIVINPNTGEILRDYETRLPRFAQQEDRNESSAEGTGSTGASGGSTASSTATRVEGATADVVDLVDPGTTLGDAPDTSTANE